MDPFLSYTSSAHPLLRRECVDCPPITPSCPPCQSSQVCVQISASCSQCAYRQCVSQQDSGATPVVTPGKHAAPSKGAIAGGVIGGVIVVGLVTYLIWRFIVRKKGSNWEPEWEDELDDTLPGPEKDIVEQHDGQDLQRPGLIGRQSVASTVLTRASNVIPIAFIPGVIGAPPVPPVPMPTTHPLISPYADQHGDTYFMPADLRDSTYSGFTDSTTSDRRSATTSSYVRGSVASTVYRADSADFSNVQVQTAQRARPAVVSVQSGGRPSSPLPAVPRIDYDRYRDAGPRSVPSAPGTANGSSSSSSGNRLSSMLNDAFSLNSTSTPAQTLSPSTSTRLNVPTRGNTVRSGPAPGLAAVIEEATRRASRQPLHVGLGGLGRREDSPFGDEHALGEEEER